MKSAFDKIMAGMEDVVAFAEGDASRGRIATVDVKAIRAATRLSQEKFAVEYRLKPATLRDWEQGRRQPDGASAVYLRMIAADPEGVQQILAKVPA